MHAMMRALVFVEVGRVCLLGNLGSGREGGGDNIQTEMYGMETNTRAIVSERVAEYRVV